ncbi:MAG: hypothetical protein HC905_03875 [Bacteroidales bacterium]|nr:hypothetical protein [Bacteroidales bacterium]
MKSELSEKQIEADIATYFGWISPIGSSSPFLLSDVDEQVYGADKKFDMVIPIYMQFKVSHGLTNFKNFTSPFSIELPLQRIRAFRHRKNLFDSPSLYFKLHAKSKTALDYQHNILMKFANTSHSYAFYVAPLTLYKNIYENLLFNSAHRYLHYPFLKNDVNIIHEENWTSYFGLIPFLRGHISIVPHEHICTHHHYYSFSPNGTDIAWHSGKIISNHANRLSDMLKIIFSSSFSNPEKWISITDYISKIKNIKEFNFL